MSDQQNNREMSPYAPIRFHNKLWWGFSEEMAKNGKISRDGRFNGDVPSMIFSNLIVPMFKTIFDKPNITEEYKGFAAPVIAKLYEFRHWVPLTSQYLLSGKQIFDLNDNLVEMLSNTDLGECTLENWKAPYEAFFMRFGKQDKVALEFDEGVHEYADGAFIATTPFSEIDGERRIKIGFSTVKDDGSGVLIPGYYIDFTPKEQKMLLKDAIKHSVKRRIDAYKQEAGDPNFGDIINNLRMESLRECEQLITGLVELVVNGMFYLESLKGEAKSSPGRDAPPKDVADWENATPEKRVKLRKRIALDGYAIVKIVGTEFNSTQKPQGGTKKTHWRRGFWRYYRNDDDGSVRLKIWIKPTIVNKDKGDDDTTGHIYVSENEPKIH